mmetsp:Transcript_25005/g.45283  ORF Transcript_25005/g.45283 Transcript_25005/m.45283 type:complete len:228 (-) Transcript_25005:846-1529(-)
MARYLQHHLSGLGLNILDIANHVESTFREIIIITGDDLAESINCVLKAHELACCSSEHLSNVERLGHKLLDLTCAGHDKLIIFRQLVHTKNGNNVLKTLIILQELLGGTSNLVVLISDDARVKHTGSGIEGVNCGVNTKLGNGTRKHSSGIQVGKSGGRSRISQIISGHVNGLHRGDGSLGSGGNTLLERTHVSGQGWLVSDSRGNTSKKSRHFRTGLGEAENVVNE